MLKVESCCLGSSRFRALWSLCSRFDVSKHFVCVELQEGTEQSQFMTGGVVEIVQDGDFQMFVAYIQANVSCVEVLLIQA